MCFLFFAKSDNSSHWPMLIIGNTAMEMGSLGSQETEGFQKSSCQVTVLGHHRQGEWDSEEGNRAGIAAGILNSREL